MKKKLLFLLSVCALTISFIGCGNTPAQSEVLGLDDLIEPISSEIYPSNESGTEASLESEPASTEDTPTEESSDAASTELTGELTFDLPAVFHQAPELSTDPSTIYYVTNATETASNISVVTTVNDGSIYDITADMFAASLTEQFEALGHNIQVTILNKEYYDIDGRSVYKYTLEYVLNNITIRNGQCIIENGDELIYISYGTNLDDGLADDLENCLNSIRFE